VVLAIVSLAYAVISSRSADHKLDMIVRALVSSPDLDVQVDSRGVVTAVGIKHATAASQITGGATMRVVGARGSGSRDSTCGRLDEQARLTRPNLIVVSPFQPIKQGRFYARCRVCRVAVTKARYWSSEEIRRAEIGRALRNKHKRPSHSTRNRVGPDSTMVAVIPATMMSTIPTRTSGGDPCL
jgi:hypothetical protein